MKILNTANFGPSARYTDAHLFVIMDILDRNHRCSRKKLVEETDLGEGSIRGMLKVLKDWKWIEVIQSGVSLTETGKSNFKDFGIFFVDITNDVYGTGGYQQAILIKGAANDVTNGMAQRDLAIRNGADGASIFIIRNGKLLFPESWDVDINDPEFADRIRSTGMEEGDALMIVDSESEWHARLIAAAVGLAMR